MLLFDLSVQPPAGVNADCVTDGKAEDSNEIRGKKRRSICIHMH